MKADELFFVEKEKEFNIDKMKVHPLIKKRWNEGGERATKNPEGYRKDIEMLSDIIGFEEGIKVLDVGCGVGLHVIELSNIGAHCIGLDAAEDAIKIINQIRNDFGINVKGVYGDACNLPFDDETFDVVMSQEFFEHVTDIDQAMKEQIRVLRDGGRLIIEQANLLNPFTLYNLLIKYPIRTKGDHGGIKWLLTKSKIRENLYGTGWTGKDEDVHTRLWWRMKMKQYSNLEIKEFTSYMVKRRGSSYKILEPFIGNILIIAIKRPK
jgi:ubiquinone/menaquinone biosynthesis C-methylase UbiE